MFSPAPSEVSAPVGGVATLDVSSADESVTGGGVVNGVAGSVFQGLTDTDMRGGSEVSACTAAAERLELLERVAKLEELVERVSFVETVVE